MCSGKPRKRDREVLLVTHNNLIYSHCENAGGRGKREWGGGRGGSGEEGEEGLEEEG